MRVGERLHLRVQALAFGGDAVARADDGRVVFVTGAAPGDEVRATVTEAKRDFARAIVEEVIAPSPDRVAARCPLAGTCGGCQWQHVAVAAQRRAKQAIVERALGRLGVTVAPIGAPTEPFGYRSRARFTVGEENAVGYQALRSHRVIDVPTCPLLEPALDTAMAEARRSFAGGLAPGSTIAGLVGRGGKVHLAIDGTAIGEPAIDAADEGESPFFAAADGFAQASRAGNRALRAVVAELAACDGQRVLELHAGDGNFTRDLAPCALHVLAIEGDPDAAARLRRNVPSAEAQAEPVERAAERLARNGDRFGLVLIDPPRAGARPILESLSRLTDRLIYVSCDPMTLARDAKELKALGLIPRRAIAIDMMPHTFHVETVLLLERD